MVLKVFTKTHPLLTSRIKLLTLLKQLSTQNSKYALIRRGNFVLG
jgi:hypothetical protein